LRLVIVPSPFPRLPISLSLHQLADARCPERRLVWTVECSNILMLLLYLSAQALQWNTVRESLERNSKARCLHVVMLDRLDYPSCMSEDKEWADEELRALARELGRRGGLKGGKARAEKLTPEERKEIARKAAKARWDKRGQQ
jgi:hypothetical protein